MNIGLIILGIFIALIVFGVLRSFFKRWNISERMVLLVSLLILGGMLISPVTLGGGALTFSIGGFLIPFIACIVVLTRISKKEVLRTLFAALIIGIISAALTYFFPLDNAVTYIDSTVFIGIIAGGLAFLLGRSRIGALISAALGTLFTNVFIFLFYLAMGYTNNVSLGTGNLFTSVIISSIIAVVVMEIAGEAREKVVREESGSDFLREKA